MRACTVVEEGGVANVHAPVSQGGGGTQLREHVLDGAGAVPKAMRVAVPAAIGTTKAGGQAVVRRRAEERESPGVLADHVRPGEGMAVGPVVRTEPGDVARDKQSRLRLRGLDPLQEPGVVLQDDVADEGENCIRLERQGALQRLGVVQPLLDRVEEFDVELIVREEAGLYLKVEGVDSQAALAMPAAIAVTEDRLWSRWIEQQQPLPGSWHRHRRALRPPSRLHRGRLRGNNQPSYHGGACRVSPRGSPRRPCLASDHMK